MTGAHLPGGQQLPGETLPQRGGASSAFQKASGHRRAPWKTRKTWIVLPTTRYGTM
jgi:hypothetical protein